MCTVTIVPLNRHAGGVGLRLACNRDESRKRPAARPPVVRRCGRHDAVMPVDPVSDGTWIAANDAGLLATLLNVNPMARPGPDSDFKKSRGLLIPRLMEFATPAEAAAVAAQIDARQFPPFRLLLIGGDEIAEFISNGEMLRRHSAPIGSRPHLYTSSGLGDALVEGPRRALFDAMFSGHADWEAAQQAFHRHAWPERRHLSVCMERADARTVSHTLVELDPERIALTYTPDAPDRAEAQLPFIITRKPERA